MNILVVFLLFLSACTSNTVKMTPEETKSFFENRSEIDRAFADVDHLDEHYRLRFQDCSSTKDSKVTEDCHLIECRGFQKDQTCWKTAITGKAAQELREEICCKELSSQQRSEKLNSCLSKEEELVSKRRNCFEFLQSLQFDAKRDLVQAEKAFRILCDLKGAICTKNKQKVGQGFIQEQSQRKARMGSFSFAQSPSSEPIVYSFLIKDE